MDWIEKLNFDQKKSPPFSFIQNSFSLKFQDQTEKNKLPIVPHSATVPSLHPIPPFPPSPSIPAPNQPIIGSSTTPKNKRFQPYTARIANTMSLTHTEPHQPHQGGGVNTVDMTDLRSTADSGDRAQNPNPPVPNDTSSPIQTLHESHHNPENQGALKMVSDLLLHPESDGTILISQEKAEILRLLIGVEHLINTHTLTVMQKITSRLDSIETSIVNKVVEPLPAKSPMTSWATITKKNRVQTNPQSTIRSPPPTRTMSLNLLHSLSKKPQLNLAHFFRKLQTK
ncbi:hypothetical protein MJO29_011501 [Puccinia striiformis f. sp. tritici]|nr:hypothetical protein MJO29_011501 [Puccinia striiformis f. sp. tritici]